MSKSSAFLPRYPNALPCPGFVVSTHACLFAFSSGVALCSRVARFVVAVHPWTRVDGDAPDQPLDSAVLTRLKKFSAMNKVKKVALKVSTAPPTPLAARKTVDGKDGGRTPSGWRRSGREGLSGSLRLGPYLPAGWLYQAEDGCTCPGLEHTFRNGALAAESRRMHIFTPSDYVNLLVCDKRSSMYLVGPV